jgi:hypothetical protein
MSVSDLFIPKIGQPVLHAAGKYVDQFWEYINHLQTHECGIGTKAAQFLFWQHINGIFVAVLEDLHAKNIEKNK